MSNIVVSFDNVQKSYGRLDAVSGMNLQIPKGSVMALLGPNGAGKTTSIKMMLDLLKPDGGTVHVLGLDPQKSGVEIRRRCGYVPERPHMIPWMSIDRILSFVSSYYSDWDSSYCSDLIRQFKLDRARKVKALSRGEEAKLALVLCLAHRPELLILDDATSGIDPSARKEIMEGIITHLHSEGVTVVFATHMLNEIEGLADRVAFMMNGSIARTDTMENIKTGMKKIVLWADNPPSTLPGNPKIISAKQSSRCHEWIIDGYQADSWVALSASSELEIHDLSLEEIYLALHDGKVG